jgi:hypothetical protein
MAGNALSRNPAMPTVAYDRLTSSALEGQIAFASEFAGADIKDDRPQFTFANPEIGEGSKDEERFLTGSAAYKAAISSSVLGTGFAPGFFQQKASSYGASISINQENPDGLDGQYYTLDPDALSLGPAKNSMPAALISDLSEEEKKVYTDSISLINQNINLGDNTVSLTGFLIHAYAKDKAALSTFREAGGLINDQGVTMKDFAYRNLPESFIDLPDPSGFYPSLSLMKMLIELTGQDGLTIGGLFGFSRGSNLAGGEATMSEAKGKQIISDHSFGRAFDIFTVGEKNVSGSSRSVNAANYTQVFSTLMKKIAGLPPYLQPDSVVISRGMFSQYLSPGSPDSERRGAFGAAFPGLAKHLKVGHDAEGSTNHDNHIHVAFHWTRAGNPSYFLGKSPLGSSGDSPIGLAPSSPSSFASTQDLAKYIELSKKSYAQEPDRTSAAINQDGDTDYVTFGKIMATTGLFNLEEIALFCGIAYRESNARPRATDGKALGIFQTELGIGTTFENKDFEIPYGESSRFKGGKRTLKGWQIAFKKEVAQSLNDARGKTMSLSTVDPVFFYPINQIAIAAQFAGIYKPSQGDPRFSASYKEGGLRTGAQSKKLWSNWADGRWGGEKIDYKYGVLTRIPVRIVYNVYTGMGGNWKTFVDWALGSRRAVNGALVDARVSQIQAIFNGSKVYFPYRSYWDVFVWVFNLFNKFEEINGEFTFTQSTAYGKGFTTKRNQMFTEATVQSKLTLRMQDIVDGQMKDFIIPYKEYMKLDSSYQI